MIRQFLKDHPYLSVKISYFTSLGGRWVIQIYNSTFDRCIPIFEYTLLEEELNDLNVVFETALMTPVLNWWDNRHKKEENYDKF